MDQSAKEAEERKRVFKFYKQVPDDQTHLDEIDRSLDSFVSSTTAKGKTRHFIQLFAI